MPRKTRNPRFEDFVAKPDPLNWRRRKRFERSFFPNQPLENAFWLGAAHAWNGKPPRNPYPKGIRHDAYCRGYTTQQRPAPRAPA